jgi:hypothetical protein
MSNSKSTSKTKGGNKKGVYRTKARITAHLKVKANGQPRRKGW